jgi:hypothetical protein
MAPLGELRRPDLAPAMVRAQHRSRALGKLVQFDKRGRHPKARPLVAGNAQIFLFTGVRYERDGTPVPGKPVNRPKRKRG